MKKKYLILLVYCLVEGLAFYLLPLFIKDTGGGMLILLCIFPCIVGICSTIYGALRGIDFMPPVITAILFAPTIDIYYNSSAWVYAIVYAGIALLGSLLGRVFCPNRRGDTEK